MTGLCAGSMNGIILSPLSVIKYHGWGNGGTFVHAAKDILKRGGVRQLYKGVMCTVARDAVFGVTYEIIRGTLRKYAHVNNNDRDRRTRTVQFMCDTLAAGAASMGSSPLNYARNVIYNTPPDRVPPSVLSSIGALVSETRRSERPLLRVVEERLFMGWGAVRVAVGMGLGQLVYAYAKEQLAAYAPKF